MSLRSFANVARGGFILAACLGCQDSATEPPPLVAGRHDHYHVHAVDVTHDHDHDGAARGGHVHDHIHPGADESSP